MRMLAAAVATSLALAAPATAQDDSARLIQLMSQDFARQSLAALHEGDRPGALALALRGLPDQPTAEDLVAHSDAMFALELAYGARVPRIDQDRDARFSVNSDGTRAFVSHWENSARPAQQGFPQALIDPRDASVIKELDPQIDVHGITTPGLTASFSPDGTILAVPTNKTAAVHLFAAGDGSYLGVLSPRSEGKGIGYEIGFSADGRLFARGHAVPGAASINVWDVGTQRLIHYLPMSNASDGKQWPLGWDHDGGLLVQTVKRNPTPGAADQLLIQRWAFDGAKQDLFETTDHPFDADLSAFSYPSTGLLFLSGEKGVQAVELATGNIRFSVPSPGAYIALARNGSTVVLRPRKLVPPNQFLVFDLAGNRLETSGADAIPFMHAIFSAQGHRIGQSRGLLATTYLGEDLPQGLALYETVWAGLSDAEQSEINTERVPRP